MICNICPRKCGIDRGKSLGVCSVGEKIKISRATLHFYEEPCISGEQGSGTVFFSGCNLKCVYCQNRIISDGYGKEISEERLVEIFFELKEKGALNINIVTPDHYTHLLKSALITAKNRGLDLPIVYNTSGYCEESVIEDLDGLVDIYLTDFKYFNPISAKKYSSAKNYPLVAKQALKAMYKTVGKPEFFDNGIMKKGIIVRVLVIPTLINEAKDIIEYLYSEYSDNIYISIMNQFTPLNLENYPEINRKLTADEYDEVVGFARMLGIKNAFIQEGDTAKESFIPDFCGFEGV